MAVERKNALLLFAKLPEVGKVKTRLTTLKDGVLSPEVASALYHCMFFDVVEICCDALELLEATPSRTDSNGEEIRDTYELYISTTPAENLPLMEALFQDSGRWPRSIHFINDQGSSFDEHYNDAFNKVWADGAHAILSMGVDMPALTVADVVRGFEKIHDMEDQGQSGIVLAPDQEMGVSIIGWSKETTFSHDGIFYNKDGLTVLSAYIDKARQESLAAIYLPPVPDVDTMADLMHTITLVDALQYCSQFDGNTPPWRTLQALEEMGWAEVRVPANDLIDPRDHIDA